jgi:hypothetical protein
MERQDQSVRRPGRPGANVGATDARLTSRLKEIVARHGWPDISLVGVEASSAAMLILIHSSDHDWQRHLIPELERLADAERIDRHSIAYVIDKLLAAEGKPQRFGTQLETRDGRLQPVPVEDPAGLDQRRAAYWLGSAADYLKFAAAQHK